MSSKTIKRALTTPALLSQILLYIHPDALKPCTTVSQAWSNLALDYMWEVVSSLQPVLRLLAPLETDRKQRKAIIRFSKPIDRKAWERFKSYARRIRVLCFDDGKDYDLCQVALALTSSVSNANISRQSIFPNLRKLSCVGSPLSLAQFFISPNLLNLAMTTDASHDDLSFFTSILPLSVPHLQTLSISCYWCSKSDGAKDADIMAMLEKMPTVVDVEVPSGWLSRLPPSAVDLLAERPKLRRLAASLELEDSGPGPCLGLASVFCPHLEKDRFSSLRELEIVSPIRLAMPALSTKAKTRIPLTKLCISDPGQGESHYASAEEITSFLKMVSTNYPGLKHLSIEHNYSFDDSLNPFPEQKVTFEHLKPLLRLSQLNFLRLRHVLDFKLEKKELLRLLKSLPKLKTLHLNERPVQYIDSNHLPISVLSSLPSVCPNMEMLAIHIDPMETPSRLRKTLPKFQKLQELCVGRSEFPVEAMSERTCDPQGIAQFLSRILPEDCQLTYDFESDLEYCRGGEDYSADFTKWWDKVNRHLEAIRQGDEVSSSSEGSGSEYDY